MDDKKLLTEEEVRHVAKLSRLGLSAKEVKKYSTQLSAILDFVTKLNEVDTDGAEPTAQVTGLTNVLRKDKVKQSLSQKSALSTSKHAENGYVKVKAVIK